MELPWVWIFVISIVLMVGIYEIAPLFFAHREKMAALKKKD